MTRLWVARTQGMECYVYVSLWLIFVLQCVGQPVGSSFITNYECARNAARIFFLNLRIQKKSLGNVHAASTIL
jgi:hypothetical protein